MPAPDGVELRAQGYPFNVKTVAASLRRQGLRAKACGSSARSATAHTACLCQKICWSRIFTPVARTTRSRQDITYLRTDEGWLYLAVVIDLWSRAIIGWSMSPRMDAAQLACDALRWRCGGVEAPEALSFTRTWRPYCSADYQAQLKRHNLLEV
ncbi:DDE-type integrase/transposase/recombinase [Shigella flexneri]